MLFDKRTTDRPTTATTSSSTMTTTTMLSTLWMVDLKLHYVWVCVCVCVWVWYGPLKNIRLAAHWGNQRWLLWLPDQSAIHTNNYGWSMIMYHYYYTDGSQPIYYFVIYFDTMSFLANWFRQLFIVRHRCKLWSIGMCRDFRHHLKMTDRKKRTQGTENGEKNTYTHREQFLNQFRITRWSDWEKKPREYCWRITRKFIREPQHIEPNSV